jgi:hypothetical protein
MSRLMVAWQKALVTTGAKNIGLQRYVPSLKEICLFTLAAVGMMGMGLIVATATAITGLPAYLLNLFLR